MKDDKEDVEITRIVFDIVIIISIVLWILMLKGTALWS